MPNRKYSLPSSEFRNDLFATLTYERTRTKGAVLRGIRNDIYTFTRKLRKSFGPIEYLRAIELHKDDYAHLHFHILFRDFGYTTENYRYLPDTMFKTLKASWTLGHTDFQPPRGKGYGVVRYTLKYLNKTSSSNTLWSKILATTVPSSDEHTQNQTDSAQDTDQSQPVIKESPYILFLTPATKSLWPTLSYSSLKWAKLKKISWSRGYVEELISRCNEGALSSAR